MRRALFHLKNKASRHAPWSERFKDMGDEAEGVFEELYNVNGVGFARFGFNRPNLHMSKLPTHLRYAPDYVTEDGFVEVQGFGRDQTCKLKVDKWEALRYWDCLHPVYLFVYDSFNKRSTTIALRDVGGRSVRLDKFPEGKPYFAIDASDIFTEVAK